MGDWDERYRQLDEGETILPDDEVQDEKGHWHRTICAGTKAPDPRYMAHRVYRRRIQDK